MAAAAVMPIVMTAAHAQSSRQISKPDRNQDGWGPGDAPSQAVSPGYSGAGYSGGGSTSASPLAQREMIRRQDDVRRSDELLLEGRKAYADGDFEQAVSKFKEAYSLIENLGPVAAQRKTEYMAHWTDAAIALSQQYRRRGGKSPDGGGKGTYEDARELLQSVLVEDPQNVLAKRELGFLDDPIRTNPALTYAHTEDIDEVRRTLYTGEGAFNLGKYDQAKAEFEKVLCIDPYNKAARRWLERVSQAKSDYYRAAYDHTRAELLSQVDAAWELSVACETPTFDNERTGLQLDTDGTTYIMQKLRTIVIPIVDFEDTSVEEAIDFLRMRSIELDTLELDPNRKGINFVIRKPKLGGADAGVEPADGALGLGLDANPGSARITELRMRNVPMATVLKYIVDATRLRYKVDDFAVTIVPATETSEDLFNRTFEVPPDFLSSIEEGGGGAGGGEVDPFAPNAGAAAGGALRPRKSVEEMLKDKGVQFPDGASASFNAGTSTLVVRNTPTNIDVIEQLVEASRIKTPRQIKILTKFVEVSQENTDELGFDWIVSPFGVGGESVFLGGGTIGNGLGRTANDFINPVNGVNIPGIPGAGSLPGELVSNIITGGVRSGDGAISRNSIDAVLNNPNRTAQTANVAPGILALTGLFSDGQVQLIMRGLAQKKGADIMTAPSVTARSGQKATIEIIREFIYPTEYEPPELPNQVGTSSIGGGIGGLGGGSAIFPVTPATPTAFETRNTGVTLEIEPTVGTNDYVIDLRFAPEIVEFEGFINYGSPIQSPSSDALGNPTTVTITENRIEMPVFATRKVNTALTIYDGYTVAVGGLMSETVQNVEDSVPILGDIPIIGRLFQTKAENRIKSNLIIFVTARIIDATGRPLGRTGSEAAEGLNPISSSMPGGSGVLPELPN